jgi:hypothetical protein
VDLWNMQEFRAGLGFGTVTAAALLFAAIAFSARGRWRPLPLGGVVIAAGGLWAIADNQHVPAAVILGVIGLGGVGALTSARWLSRWYCVALAVPFAWTIGFHGGLVADVWARVFVTVAASLGAILVAEFDHTWRAEAPGLTLLAVSTLGVYATVPDTEFVAAMVGVSLPLLVLGWPARLATLGRAGAPVAVGSLMWAGASGGVGRPASIVSVVVCLGLLVGVPAGQLLLPQAGDVLRRLPRGPLMLCLLASHIVLVFVGSRVVGHPADLLTAGVLGALTGFATVMIGALFRPPSHAVALTRVD